MDGQRTTTSAVSDRKDPGIVLVSCGVILPAAFLFSSVSALPHVFLVVFAALVLSLLVRKPLRYSDRSLIYSFVGALLLAVLLDMVFPMKQDRFFVMAKLFMANISVPVILYLAVFATFYQSNQYTIGFASSLSVIALMLCANYQLSGANEADLPGIAFLLDHFKLFYVSVVSFDTVMILFALNIARKSARHQSASGFDWRKHLVYLTAITIAATSAYLFFSLTLTFKNEILKAEMYLRKFRMRGVPSASSGAFFGKEVDLRAGSGASRNKNRDMVMLRVVGDIPPGYLRGRVYQYYKDARWTSAPDLPRQMHYRVNVDGLAVNAFFKEKFPGDVGDRFDVYPTSACRADFMFLPGNTIRIDTVADRIGFTKNGFFKPKTWESDGGYTVSVPKLDQTSAYPVPDVANTERGRKYLQTPSDLQEVLDSTLEAVLSEAASTDGADNGAAVRGDRRIVEKVKNYFLENFKYKLVPDLPKDKTDPVEYFLTKTKSGHCELFASATAMLLRRAGIPTRYITGLVCFESHPSGKYFVSRLGNAHAWVEAYLRDEREWVLVESTPASADEFHTSFGLFDAWGDRFKQLWRKTFAGIRRGYVARSILTGFTSLFGFLFDLLWDPLRGAFALVSMTVLWWLWRRSIARNHSLFVELHPETAALSARFARRLKRIQKKYGIAKSPEESLEEWSARIAAEMPDDAAEKLGGLVAAYNKLRFSGAPPDRSAARRLDDMLRDLCD